MPRVLFLASLPSDSVAGCRSNLALRHRRKSFSVDPRTLLVLLPRDSKDDYVAVADVVDDDDDDDDDDNDDDDDDDDDDGR